MSPGTLEMDLIALARRGDTAAFESLLRPLLVPACRLAYSLLHDWEEAEDVVQEAAIKAWQALPRLREGTLSLRPWFLTIAANQARSVRRRRGFGTLTLGSLSFWQPAAPVAVHGSEDLIDLRRAAGLLNEAQRLLLFLRYCLDLPLEEAAEVVGLSPAAAKSKLYRALRAMRPALEDPEV